MERNQIKYLNGRLDVLEEDRLSCRESHWRLALQTTCNTIYKSAADELAKACLDSDAIIDPRVSRAVEFWRGLAKENAYE
jgi:hypothetical protein